MLVSQMVSGVWFYIIFSLFGAIGLPLVARLFPNKILAYAAAKPVGLILFAYVIWLLGSFRILDYQKIALITGLYIVAIVVGIYFSRNFLKEQRLTEAEKAQAKKHGTKRPRSTWSKILWVEATAIVVYLAYLWLRSHNAQINGTERFMDMALLTSAGKTHFFPFLDAWYAGKTVNYYYYGSYLVSLISNLAHIPYALSYNFALGLLYAETALLSSALVWAMTGSKKIAIVAAFLVTTAGNLFFAGCTLNAAFLVPQSTCSYASSTRLYTPSYIINEIPSYSFTVGDLHAHLLALPFFVLGLILLYGLAKSKRPNFWTVLLLALSLATSGMINAWDGVTLALLVAALALIKALRARYGPQDEAETSEEWPRSTASAWIVACIEVVLIGLALMWPNLRAFHSPVLGLGFIPSYVSFHALKNVQWPTPPMAELGMWGVLIIGGLWGAIVAARRKMLANIDFLAALAILSIGIIIGVELFFIKDIYSVANPPFFRANTTFKFGYHAWTMLCIAFSVLIAAATKRLPQIKSRLAGDAAWLIMAVAVIGGMFYPYQAIFQFYLPNKAQAAVMPPPTLDGAAWMAANTKGDLDTINYINKNFPDRAVIAEAVGDSYTTYSRITTYTGMITPMGWMSHEWTWRFDGTLVNSAPAGATVETGWGAVSKVGADIESLYETASASEAKQIIAEYGIKYVYIGGLEHEKYPTLQAQKFYQIGHVVFQSNGSQLFAIN